MAVDVTVLYFAAARERAGTDRERLTFDAPPTVRELAARLAALHPELGRLLPHLRIAVDQEFARPEERVPQGAEVALIPPVAGGAGGPFKVVDRPLSLDEVVKAVSGEGMGGLVTFTGSVRDQTRGRRVARLEYEAYAPMAERTFAKISQEAAEKWPGVRLAIVHRTGTLVPGDWAVVIAAAAPHRDEAFLACRHAIDRLKQDAPIWKREVYEDGEVWVGLGP